jgi:hypothetical protein
MEGLNIIELFQTGGVVLVFIGFLIWLVRYFMTQIDKFQEERKSLQQQFDNALENHCTQVTKALVEQQHKFEMLCEKIDDLVDAMSEKGVLN